MNKCISCDKIKYPFEFHKDISSGFYFHNCKVCRNKEKYNLLMCNSENYEKEKERHRDKYHRLDYKQKHKPTPEKKKEAMDKYKEKYPEKTKAKILSQRLPCEKGNHLHHWSYNIKDAKDCIELSPKEHSLIHRFIDYDQSTFMYKDLKGNLLDTKEKHLSYISNVLKSNIINNL